MLKGEKSFGLSFRKKLLSKLLISNLLLEIDKFFSVEFLSEKTPTIYKSYNFTNRKKSI